MPEAHDRVVADAARLGIPIEIVQQGAVGSLQEAADVLGVAPGSIVKTLVVKRHDGTFLFALVPGGRQISWPKLRAVVGVNKLRMPEPEVATEATGFERGTITPLGSTTAWPVFADETVGGRIALGGGEPGLSVFVDAQTLVTAFGAVVADITEPERG